MAHYAHLTKIKREREREREMKWNVRSFSREQPNKATESGAGREKERVKRLLCGERERGRRMRAYVRSHDNVAVCSCFLGTIGKTALFAERPFSRQRKLRVPQTHKPLLLRTKPSPVTQAHRATEEVTSGSHSSLTLAPSSSRSWSHEFNSDSRLLCPLQTA